MDSSVRGLAAEVVLKQNPDLKTLKELFNVLKKEKKGFASFVISRIAEFVETDPDLEKRIRFGVKISTCG